jgi:hypothetical protein
VCVRYDSGQRMMRAWAVGRFGFGPVEVRAGSGAGRLEWVEVRAGSGLGGWDLAGRDGGGDGTGGGGPGGERALPCKTRDSLTWSNGLTDVVKWTH